MNVFWGIWRFLKRISTLMTSLNSPLNFFPFLFLKINSNLNFHLCSNLFVYVSETKFTLWWSKSKYIRFDCLKVVHSWSNFVDPRMELCIQRSLIHVIYYEKLSAFKYVNSRENQYYNVETEKKTKIEWEKVAQIT